VGHPHKAPAKDRLTIFEGKVVNEFLTLGVIYEQFAPSLFLLTQKTSLKWGMLNPDTLESGSMSNAFLFMNSDVKVAQGINHHIDFIQQGRATPLYADTQILLKAKIILLGPEDSIQCILHMLAVYCAILPKGHPLVSFLLQHYGYMHAYDPRWTTYSTHIPHCHGLKGVFHFQWLSLKLTQCFSQLDHNIDAVRMPNPHEIIDYIQKQCQWEPNLTNTFISRYNLHSFHAGPLSTIPE
jgi:hypothetical protein